MVLMLVFAGNLFAQYKLFYIKGTNPHYNIYSINLDGSGEKLLKTDVMTAGYGSGKICFIDYTDGTEIKSINSDGTGGQAIANTGDITSERNINFSSDGNKIIYSGSNNVFKSFIINIDGTGKTVFNDGSGLSQHQLNFSWNQ